MIKTLLVQLFLVVSITSLAQDGAKLKTADSLFATKKYTEALGLYKELYANNSASPAMLLKMAFVHDGSQQYPEALYFLDLYYRTTADRLVLPKIEELASTNELSGYQYTDLDYFKAVFFKYRFQILILLILFLVLTTLFHVRKIQKAERSNITLAFQVILTLFLLAAINFREMNQGIVTSDFTTLRESPAAGASISQIITKGHKVKVVDQGLIWTLIEWEGELSYIKTARLRLI